MRAPDEFRTNVFCPRHFSQEQVYSHISRQWSCKVTFQHRSFTTHSLLMLLVVVSYIVYDFNQNQHLKNSLLMLVFTGSNNHNWWQLSCLKHEAANGSQPQSGPWSGQKHQDIQFQEGVYDGIHLTHGDWHAPFCIITRTPGRRLTRLLSISEVHVLHCIWRSWRIMMKELGNDMAIWKAWLPSNAKHDTRSGFFNVILNKYQSTPN